MMAGYSETPLVKKLDIKPGARLTLVGAPEGFREMLGELPAGVKVIGVQKPLDVLVFFPKSQEDLSHKFAKLAAKMSPNGRLWVAWPKKASGVETDLSFEGVRQAGLEAGLVDNKVCAVDEVYSGLCFVFRLQDRS
jgi:hypothetical protein